jgi:hypothetical protein
MPSRISSLTPLKSSMAPTMTNLCFSLRPESQLDCIDASTSAGALLLTLPAKLIL